MMLKRVDKHRKSTFPFITEKHMPTRSILKDGEKNHVAKLGKGLHGIGKEGSEDTTKKADNTEEYRRKKAFLQQRHLQAYKSVYQLRDVLHKQYSELLLQKVNRQKLELKQRDFKTAKPQKVERPVRQTLPHVTLSHDDTHLKGLHKNSYYLIVGLQNQMRNCGWLKTHWDQEEFWSLVIQNQRVNQIENKLEEIQMKMTGSSRSAPALKCLTSSPVSKTAITRAKEGHQEQGPSSQTALSEGDSGTCNSTHQPCDRQRPEQDTTEQMFPMLQVPKFASLQPGFLDQLKSHPNLRLCDTSQKPQTTGACLRKLHQMYSLSLTNMANSQRLLNRDTHCPLWESKDRDWNLVQYFCPREVSRTKHRNVEEISLSQQSYALRSSPTLELNTEDLASTPSPTGVLLMDITPEHMETPSNGSHDPLSLEELIQKHTSVVKTGSCQTWTNYV